ncbi:MAG: hypothetical protein M1561_03805 [Gammaproteobacteria bacterium]|nr:hypothetical protein [Gammaproteobacteria bacterium]
MAGSIYIPNLFTQPKFNFLYATGGECFCSQYNQPYSIQNSKLIKNKTPITPKTPNIRNIDCDLPQNTAKLFIHDTVKNENEQISLATAQKLNLDPNNKSPDGFEIARGGMQGSIFSILFYADSRYYKGGTLQGRYASKKFNTQTLGPCNNFRFIGWIKN